MEVNRKDQRRQRLQQLKQRDILDAAEQIFGQKGYLEASVQDIAELAEFSLSALYRLYDSKEALFAAVLARRGIEIGQGLHTILTREESPRQKLHQWVDFSISFHHQHPNYSRMYLLMVTTSVPLLGPRREAEHYRPPDAASKTTQLFREG